jgi:His-Xaa-Ser system protein HxsD
MKEIIKKIEDGRLLVEVTKRIYNENAITYSAYKFTDRCYIHIDPISDEVIGVYFSSKNEIETKLEDIAQAFCNELIDQQVRLNVERSYGHIRDEIVKKAFSPID